MALAPIASSANLPLLDVEGRWQETLEVTLYPYDAATDGGSAYTSPDQEAIHQSTITLLTG